MDEFLVLLQAKLDEAKSKGLINSDIALLQGQLDKLKIQVELDPKAAQKLANDIGKLINQKIAISNINIDTNQAVRKKLQKEAETLATITQKPPKIRIPKKRILQIAAGSVLFTLTGFALSFLLNLIF